MGVGGRGDAKQRADRCTHRAGRGVTARAGWRLFVINRLVEKRGNPGVGNGGCVCGDSKEAQTL